MASIEGPQISRATEGLVLPSHLRNVRGKLMIDPHYVSKEARRGPYDIVMDFGASRAQLKDLVPESQRLKENTGNITVLGFQQPEIRQAMAVITDLANDPNKNSENPNDRQKYRESLGLVYYAMATDVTGWAGKDDVLIFSPMNGGIFVQDVFEEAGFAASDFFKYRMSRVQGNDGGLMVGVTLGKNNPEISSYRRFVFADDCIASDISAFGTLEIIKEALIAENISLSETKVLFTVSAATQRGLESLLSPETRDHFGFADMRAVTGISVYEMDGHFYLRDPDGRYVVGDMGNWTQPPTI